MEKTNPKNRIPHWSEVERLKQEDQEFMVKRRNSLLTPGGGQFVPTSAEHLPSSGENTARPLCSDPTALSVEPTHTLWSADYHQGHWRNASSGVKPEADDIKWSPEGSTSATSHSNKPPIYYIPSKIPTKPPHHFYCRICSQVFKRKSQMNRHVRRHIENRPHYCFLCKQRFTQKRSLIQHIKNTHWIQKPFTCKWCAKVFSAKKVLLVHLKQLHEKDGNFPCHLCSRKFKKFHNLEGHVKRHYGDKLPFKCQKCGKGFGKASNLKTHTRTHTGEKPYQCEVCAKCFAHLSTFTEHVKRHTQGRPYECQYCGKLYKDKLSFHGHLTIHTGIKPYKCVECGKEYGWRCSYKFHIRYAHKKRDQVCPICGQKFKQKKALEEHEIRHSWPSTYKPFQCADCKQKFTTRGSVFRHVRMVHTVDDVRSHVITFDKPTEDDFEQAEMQSSKFLSCPICTKIIQLRSSLLKHVRTQHKLDVPTQKWADLKKQTTFKFQYLSQYGQYSCSFCNSGFEHRLQLKSHLWDVHAEAMHDSWDFSTKEMIKELAVSKAALPPTEVVKKLESDQTMTPLPQTSPNTADSDILSNCDPVHPRIISILPNVTTASEQPKKPKRVRKQKAPTKVIKDDERMSAAEDNNADSMPWNTMYNPQQPIVNKTNYDYSSFTRGLPGVVPSVSDEKQTHNPLTNVIHIKPALNEDHKCKKTPQKAINPSFIASEKDHESKKAIQKPIKQYAIVDPDDEESYIKTKAGELSSSNPSALVSDAANNDSSLVDDFPPVTVLTQGQTLLQKQARNISVPWRLKDGILTCPVCDSKFETHEMLKYHMRSHPGECPFKCKTCKKNFSCRLSLKRHQLIHAEVRPHICSVCDKGYTRRIHLKKHMMSHTGEKMCQCTQCGKWLSDAFSLKSHNKIHSGDLQHKCPVCSKAFVSGSTLRKHLVIHTGEKPYKCHECGRGFSQHGHLTSHMRTHTGERPYKCELCTKAFTISTALKNHMMIHTNQRPWACTGCDKKFRRNHHLQEHLRGNGCPGKVVKEGDPPPKPRPKRIRKKTTKSQKKSAKRFNKNVYSSNTDDYDETTDDSELADSPVSKKDISEQKLYEDGSDTEDYEDSKAGIELIHSQSDISESKVDSGHHTKAVHIKTEPQSDEYENCDSVRMKSEEMTEDYDESVRFKNEDMGVWVKHEPEDEQDQQAEIHNEEPHAVSDKLPPSECVF